MKKRSYQHLFVLAITVFPLLGWTDAPVEEATLASSTGGYSSLNTNSETPLAQDNGSIEQPTSPSFNPRDPASLLSKINGMQTEIQQLHGQLEVQSHTIQKLQEQQKAYYADLDQRISALASPNKAATPALPLDTAATDTTPATTTSSATPDTPAPQTSNVTAAGPSPLESSSEDSSYNAAYELISSKQFSQATEQMKTFIQQFPNGKLTPNAHYWLGELFMSSHQEQEAIKEFQIVINQYPSSSKVSAAMLKLGFAYAQLGDTARARSQLLNVEQMFPGTAPAQLAHQRLETLN